MQYHAYLVREKNQIEKRIDFDAADEHAALDQASELIDGCAVELWSEDGLIGRLPPVRTRA